MNRVAAVERALLGLVKPPVVQAFLVVLCLMHGAVAEAQHRYAITKVEGPSPETFLAVSGLNDKGEIVGNIAGSGHDDNGPQINPEELAELLWSVHQQPRSCWTSELDVRPAEEEFWEHC